MPVARSLFSSRRRVPRDRNGDVQAAGDSGWKPWRYDCFDLELGVRREIGEPCGSGQGRSWCRSSSRAGRHRISTAAGLRRAAPLAGDPVQLLPSRPPAAHRGPSVSARPAHRGGDHRRHWRPPARFPEGIRLRGVIVVLWRAPGFGSAKCSRSTRPIWTRVRWSSGTARATSVARSGWIAGAGHISIHGLSCSRRCRPGGCSACYAVQPAGGRARLPASAASLHRAAQDAGVRRRFAPHQLGHPHAAENVPRGIPLLVIQRQLGHAELAITSAYLRAIDNTEVIQAVHQRAAPMIPAGQRLSRRR